MSNNQIRMFTFDDKVFFFENVEITTNQSNDPIDANTMFVTGDLIVPVIIKEKMRLDLFLLNIDKSLLRILDKELSAIVSLNYEKIKTIELIDKNYPLYKFLSFDKKIATPLIIMYNAIMWFITITMRKFSLYSEKKIPMIIPGVYDSGTREPLSFIVPSEVLDTKFVRLSKEELEMSIRTLVKNT